MMLKCIISLVLVCALATTTTHAIQKRQTIGSNTEDLSTVQKPDIVSDQNIIPPSTQGLALDISKSEWTLGKRENVLQSPFSIVSILNLLLLGTNGDSHTELKKALRYSLSLPSFIIHDNFREVLKNSLDIRVEGVNISMDSRLFLQKEAPFLDSFVTDALDLYRSKAENLDFAGNPSGSTDYINRWVNKTTYGKISKVFNEPLPPSTTFVAANTIYFNGAWEEPFPKLLTYDGVFMTGLQNLSIPMMSNLVVCNYLSVLEFGFDMISLPYKGRSHALYILTPRGDPDSSILNVVESILTPDILSQFIKQMKPVQISVSIPRMKLSHRINLKENLKLLGVKKIFDTTQADFSRLTHIPGVYVDSVLHEAILEVTETGTIAAAATSTAMDKAFGPRFIFDRPSLLFIRDDRNGVILFWARVVQPEPIYLPA